MTPQPTLATIRGVVLASATSFKKAAIAKAIDQFGSKTSVKRKVNDEKKKKKKSAS